MSSNFWLATLCCVAFSAAFGTPAVAATPLRFADVVMLPGDQLAGFIGQAIDRLAVLACTAAECHPIPFQVDERDAAGQWVLDHGPRPMSDDPRGVFDANDLLLFMAGDAGEPAAREALLIPPPCHEGGKGEVESAGCVNLPGPLLGKEGFIGAAITLHDPLDGTTRWAYVAAFADHAPRAARESIGEYPGVDYQPPVCYVLAQREGQPT